VYCISDEMEDKEEVKNVGNEHEYVSNKCQKEDGNCEDTSCKR
jgi:hypothetical protein